MAKSSADDLMHLYTDLQAAYTSIRNFTPCEYHAAVVDDSYEPGEERTQVILPGLAKLKESVKRDMEAIEKSLSGCSSLERKDEYRLSTNAPYLLAVWHGCLSARHPIAAVSQHFQHGPGIVSNPSEREAKVDIVANGGRDWIRINTITATRLMYEFRELDAYISDSSSDASDPSGGIGPDSTTQDPAPEVSLIRMAKSLVAASRANPLPLLKGEDPEFPTVTIRLTRLQDYSAESPTGAGEEDRLLTRWIAQVLDDIRHLGVELEFGEQKLSLDATSPRSPSHPGRWHPTVNINLDLSLLIALVSDLTHCELPATAEEAISRFQSGISADSSRPRSICDNPNAGTGGQAHVSQSGALAQQLRQEMQGGLLDMLRGRLSCHLPAVSSCTSEPRTLDVEFWTTSEARDRFFDIVFTIGGDNERRRAKALFGDPPSRSGGECLAERAASMEEQEHLYWLGSRYPPGYLPLLPIHVVESSGIRQGQSSATQGAIFIAMAKTCRELLSQQQHPKPTTKSKITPHTLRSLLFGAERGWTTLTANRTSVKTLVSEVRARYGRSLLLYGEDTGDAAIWVVNPRSLAEGMYKDRQK
ncbi:hypothetical protein OE88DRAFT_1739668 [Heliocybe sulcata]|uniref:DUF1308 domain-containing protein n=1 Tax=Heliocybe sulcata TaxID=5364 RepID=A0A5C3MPB5_9AGAM|nr:hypothetical protein OE88DRAFT_1739668 [Heliocybe sulcata]